VVGFGGGGAEVGARRRQELTGEKGNVGDRALVKDWRRGGVVELQRGAVKLPRWSSRTRGARSGGSAATNSSPTNRKEAVAVFWTLVNWRANERVEWEERELVLLLNQKRGGEGACIGGCCDGEVVDGQTAGQRGTRAREPGRRS
jgi:hypothetical protein